MTRKPSAGRAPARSATCLLAVVLSASGQVPEASPPPAAATAPAPAAAVDAAALRDAAQQTFLRLIDEKRYEEAIAIAAQVVDLTTRMHGQDSMEMVTPLTNLGTAQMQHGDLLAAESSYRQAIAIVERRDGLVSPRLVNPLVGLAATYARGGLYQQAAETYHQALHANHTSAGFYNLEQLRIRDGLSETFLGIGELAKANSQQRIQLTIHKRHAPEDSAALAEALQKLGRWYNRTGQYPEAQSAFQEARRIIRASGGDKDPAMVDSYLGEALAYGNEGAIPASAAVLKRGLDLIDSQEVVDHRKRAQLLVALGDLYIVARQPRAARQRYAEAWRDLSGDDALLADRDRYFAQPSRIGGPQLPDVVDVEGKELKASARGTAGQDEGVVVAMLTVTADGRADGARIIESTPPGLMDRQMLRMLDAAAFRPAMAEGEPVDRPDVQLRHAFRYPRPAPGHPDVPLQSPGPGSGAPGGPLAYPGSDGDRHDGT
ncbi:MAG: TonB family protein [Gammaproteobacteria bacterium]|nr:MAG: TonB family protein [Gammaproteobacteria bacterium]